MTVPRIMGIKAINSTFLPKKISRNNSETYGITRELNIKFKNRVITFFKVVKKCYKRELENIFRKFFDPVRTFDSKNFQYKRIIR